MPHAYFLQQLAHFFTELNQCCYLLAWPKQHAAMRRFIIVRVIIKAIQFILKLHSLLIRLTKINQDLRICFFSDQANHESNRHTVFFLETSKIFYSQFLNIMVLNTTVPHTSKINSLCSSLNSKKTLQNLLYFQNST